MRFYLLIAVTLFLVKVQAKSPTDSSDRNNLLVVKADVLMPSIGLINKFSAVSISLEYGFNIRHSIQLSGLFFRQENRGSYELVRSKYLIEDYKYFFNAEKAYTGFYGGIYSDQFSEYALSSEPGYEIEYKTFSIGGGAHFGYQNYIGKRISYDFIFGFGKSFKVKQEIIQGSVILFDSWPDLRLAFNFGFRF